MNKKEYRHLEVLKKFKSLSFNFIYKFGVELLIFIVAIIAIYFIIKIGGELFSNFFV